MPRPRPASGPDRPSRPASRPRGRPAPPREPRPAATIATWPATIATGTPPVGRATFARSSPRSLSAPTRLARDSPPSPPRPASPRHTPPRYARPPPPHTRPWPRLALAGGSERPDGTDNFAALGGCVVLAFTGDHEIGGRQRLRQPGDDSELSGAGQQPRAPGGRQPVAAAAGRAGAGLTGIAAEQSRQPAQAGLEQDHVGRGRALLRPEHGRGPALVPAAARGRR